MLVEFSVANFRSFRDRVTLSLEAEPRVRGDEAEVDARNVVHTEHGDLLRVVGIYGANAGGKSNLVSALTMLKSMVVNSAREGQVGDTLPARPFRLDAESLAASSEMEVVFIRLGDQVRYDVAFTAKRVEREWLFVRPAGADVEERWSSARARSTRSEAPGFVIRGSSKRPGPRRFISLSPPRGTTSKRRR